MVFICRPVSYRTLSKTLRQTLRISLISDDNYYSDRLLGDRRKRIYRIVRSFCPDSRRNNRRIVNYATVIATPKLGKRTSKLVCSLIERTLLLCILRVFRLGRGFRRRIRRPARCGRNRYIQIGFPRHTGLGSRRDRYLFFRDHPRAIVPQFLDNAFSILRMTHHVGKRETREKKYSSQYCRNTGQKGSGSPRPE